MPCELELKQQTEFPEPRVRINTDPIDGTKSGWDEAAAAAADAGVEFVPGVEVSCRHRGVSIHLLAYWPDPGHEDVSAMMAKTRDARIDRAKEIVAKIAADFPLRWEQVAAQAEGSETVGRPHIADAMVTAGLMPDRDAAFVEVLGGNSRYFVPHYAPEVRSAVRALRSSGGVPVFAHPGADGRGRVVPTSVIEGMAKAGMVGIEIDHRDHSQQQRNRLERIAHKLGLVRTGASDYHGTGKQNVLGENLTTPAAFATTKEVLMNPLLLLELLLALLEEQAGPTAQAGPQFEPAG